MIIKCSECSTNFDLDESHLKESGSKVRCSVCKHIFVAYPPVAPDSPEEPGEPDKLTVAVPAREPEQEAQYVDTHEPDEEIKTPVEDEILEETPEIESEQEEIAGEPDLSDIEKMLETDLDAETGPEAGEAEAEPGLDDAELDLSLLDEMDEMSETVEGEAPESVELEESGELDLGMELEPESEEGVVEIEAESGLDDAELDLSLLDEMDETDDMSETVEGETPESLEFEESGELDLGMELEPEAEEGAVEVEAELGADDELDLSDIDKMLATYEGTVVEEGTEDQPADLDLDLDEELETAQAAGEIGEGVEETGTDELDLSDLDMMLETQDGEEAEADAEEEPGDLDLDLDLDVEDAEAEEMQLEFDIDEESDDETVILDSAGPDETPDMEIIDETEGDQVEFDITDEQEAEDEEELYEKTIDIDSLPDDFDDFKTPDAEEADVEVADEKPKPAAKKGLSKPVLVLSIIAILIGGAYGIYTALGTMGIKIPFISSFLNSEVPDINKIEILQNTVSAKFVVNSKTGKLFIITGQVKNGYSDARSFISIQGKLYRTGKVLSSTVKVFCGNVLPDLELSSLELDVINKRLQNRAGDRKTNIGVKPGQMIPFMVVFSNLPEDLEEYQLEPAESFSSQ